MPTSEEYAVAFYGRLGPEGLAARTRPEWDQQIVERIRGLLQPGDRILDVGCGYGRIAIPLALCGFDVVGIDISMSLLEAARREATKAGAKAQFLHRNMCSITLPEASFDVVLCLWSAFRELLEPEEQLHALAGMHRVLKPGGLALLEGAIGSSATDDEIASGYRHGPENRIERFVIQGLDNPHFHHDISSFERLLTRIGVERFVVSHEDWAGRQRQVLRFFKDALDPCPLVGQVRQSRHFRQEFLDLTPIIGIGCRR